MAHKSKVNLGSYLHVSVSSQSFDTIFRKMSVCMSVCVLMRTYVADIFGERFLTNRSSDWVIFFFSMHLHVTDTGLDLNRIHALFSRHSKVDYSFHPLAHDSLQDFSCRILACRADGITRVRLLAFFLSGKTRASVASIW